MLLKKYQNKVYTLEAMEFLGGEESAEKLVIWANSHDGNAKWHKERTTKTIMRPDGEAVTMDLKYPVPEHVSIETRIGVMRVNIGDYLVFNGELMPSRKDLFEGHFEEAA